MRLSPPELAARRNNSRARPGGTMEVITDPASLADAQWLARRGFRLAGHARESGGLQYLEELPVSRVADWLLKFLEDSGGSARSEGVHAARMAAGISQTTLKRARPLAGVTVTRGGRGGSVWALPGAATASATAPGASVAIVAEAEVA